jgi:hypothetical protein
MDELGSQWYQAGSLLIQAGFLIAMVWSVRAILKSNRPSQEQMGALLRLTFGGSRLEENVGTGARPTPYLLDGWPLAPSAPVQSSIENKDRDVRVGVFAGLIEWLQQPMIASGVGPWRRMVQWLQSPAGS